jgi:hypothetical protein
MEFDGLERVPGAAGVIAAITSQERGDPPLVGPDEGDARSLGERLRAVWLGHEEVSTSAACAIHSTSSSNATSVTSGEAMKMYALDGSRRSRAAASRIRRLARLRCTALPTFFPATTPTSGLAVAPAPVMATMPWWRRRRPVRYSSEKRDPGRRATYPRPSGGELVASLGTATLDDGATRTVAHAAAETVLALTAAVVGLIRTLHDEVSLVGGSRSSANDRGTPAF